MKTSVNLTNDKKSSFDKYLLIFFLICSEIILSMVIFFPRVLYQLIKIDVLDLFMDFGLVLILLFIANTLLVFFIFINLYKRSLGDWDHTQNSISNLKRNLKNLTSFEKQILREFFLTDENFIEVPMNLTVINHLIDKSIVEYVIQNDFPIRNKLKLTNEATQYISLKDLDWPKAQNNRLSKTDKAWLDQNRPNWVIK